MTMKTLIRPAVSLFVRVLHGAGMVQASRLIFVGKADRRVAVESIKLTRRIVLESQAFAPHRPKELLPGAALGIHEGSRMPSLRFKWADNVRRPGDVMDFYVSGDVAPDGRFMYHYGAE